MNALQALTGYSDDEDSSGHASIGEGAASAVVGGSTSTGASASVAKPLTTASGQEQGEGKRTGEGGKATEDQRPSNTTNDPLPSVTGQPSSVPASEEQHGQIGTLPVRSGNRSPAKPTAVTTTTTTTTTTTATSSGTTATIPGPSQDECDPAVQARVQNFWQKVQSGLDFVSHLKSKKEFHNPQLLPQLIDMCGIKQYGTRYPNHLYTLDRYDENDRADKIVEAMAQAGTRQGVRKRSAPEAAGSNPGQEGESRGGGTGRRKRSRWGPQATG